MKYFWLRHSCVNADGPYLTCDPPLDSVWNDGICWSLGEPIGVALPVPIQYEMDCELPRSDYIYTTMSQFLVSSKFLDVTKKHSADISPYQSTLSYHGRMIEDDYWTVNFDTAYACLDWDKSDYTPDTDLPDRVGRLKRMVLKTDRVPTHCGIFLLYEDTGKILVSESFRRECEERGITGADFIDFENYLFPY